MSKRNPSITSRHFRSFVACAVLLLTLSAWPQNADAPPSSASTQSKEQPASPAKSQGPVEILSDTKGVDFGPYLRTTVQTIKRNWYSLIPETAQAPFYRRAKVTLQFAIQRDGHLTDLHYVENSGDVAMDRAAYGGVTLSTPFLPLPAEFSGQALVLRIHFLYNPQSAEESDSGSADQITSSESVRLSEILVSVPEPPPGVDGTQDVTAARHKAEELLAQIHAGKSFEEVAGKNPDVGYFRRGQLSKSIADVVFAMKVNDVSDVLRAKQGFVILKVTDHLQSDPKSPAAPPQTAAPTEPAKPNQ